MSPEQIREIAATEVARHYDQHGLAKNKLYARDVDRQADAFTYAIRILEAAGFAVVPREPTEEWVRNARDELNLMSEDVRECYRAMIAQAQGERG